MVEDGENQPTGECRGEHSPRHRVSQPTRSCLRTSNGHISDGLKVGVTIKATPQMKLISPRTEATKSLFYTDEDYERFSREARSLSWLFDASRPMQREPGPDSSTTSPAPVEVIRLTRLEREIQGLPLDELKDRIRVTGHRAPLPIRRCDCSSRVRYDLAAVHRTSHAGAARDWHDDVVSGKRRPPPAGPVHPTAREPGSRVVPRTANIQVTIVDDVQKNARR